MRNSQLELQATQQRQRASLEVSRRLPSLHALDQLLARRQSSRWPRIMAINGVSCFGEPLHAIPTTATLSATESFLPRDLSSLPMAYQNNCPRPCTSGHGSCACAAFISTCPERAWVWKVQSLQQVFRLRRQQLNEGQWQLERRAKWARRVPRLSY